MFRMAVIKFNGVSFSRQFDGTFYPVMETLCNSTRGEYIMYDGS